MEYRDFMSLTDDEIIFIITDIFPYTKKVDNIVRDQKSRCISCDIYIMDEYAGYSYKTRTPKDIKKKEQKNAIIRKWCLENKGFVKTLDRVSFEIAKGSWAPDDKVNAAFVRKLFKESGYENLPFTAGEFLTYWRKH